MENPNSIGDSQDMTGINGLPGCVLPEVLIHVPFSDLNESRRVHKAWNKIITDVSFVERLRSKYGTTASICLHDIELFSEGPDIVILKLDPTSSETYSPPALCALDAPQMLGSVNNTVLFGDPNCSQLFMINQTDRSVWEVTDEDPESWLYGFGYNQAESFVIVKWLQNEMETIVSVYSHRRMSWRKDFLKKFERKLEDYVGFFDGKVCFHDHENLLGFDFSMEKYWVIKLPEDLRNGVLTFGVARDQEGEVLLICCRSYLAKISSIWRLKIGGGTSDFHLISEINSFNCDTVLQPLAYNLGDPNLIVLLEDQKAVVVYDVEKCSSSEIYCQPKGCYYKTNATAFYQTSLPSLKG